jgi:hypothetical protein
MTNKNIPLVQTGSKGEMNGQKPKKNMDVEK